MELREFLLFVHIAAAIVWVGGAVTLEIFGSRVGRRGDTAGIIAFSKDAEVAGRVYGVTTALVLGFGIWMVVDSPAIDFADTWILLSLILTGLLFLMGPLFFEPSAKAIGALAAEKGGEHPDVAGRIHRVMWVGRIDSLIAFFIVWLMVVKPGA
jgi:uncharacterized membrane protein